MELTDEQKALQRIVCAALRIEELDDCGIKAIVIGPRHYDSVMQRAMDTYVWATAEPHYKELRRRWATAEQGFIDQWGNFLTRTEAWLIAFTAGQILRFVGNQNPKELMAQELFSENLY